MSIEVDMDLLIDLIQQYPYLYDIRDKSYKNNDLKEKCWEAISIQVNVPVDDCKRLWRNLRDRFNKEKRLHPDSEVLHSTWPYFCKMSFYAKYSMPRKTVVATSRLSLERPGSSTSDNSQLWGGLGIMSPEIISGTREEEQFASTTTPSEGPHNTSYGAPRSWSCTDSESSLKKIKQERILQEYEEATMSAVSNVPIPRNNVNETFGAYVVSRLKEMDPDVAKQKRKKMLLILEDDD